MVLPDVTDVIRTWFHWTILRHRRLDGRPESETGLRPKSDQLGAGCDLENSERNPVSDGRICVWHFDCVVHVGDGQNPGSKRDESSPDAVRIARSVPLPVVVGDEDRRKEERLKKRGAKPRMICTVT